MQGGRAAEYKQVTVLFADVVRSMDIAAAVDIERLREIMTELVERSAAMARRYGGTVEYTGDGVMAIFGAPIALEDHAFRACLVALAIQDEADRLAADVQRTDEVALQVRVGVNSGRVIAGEIGSGALGYHATGEQVGMAQRMESVAPAGGVMLSESTAGLVEHRVRLADPEHVRIKGAYRPVAAYRLLDIGPGQRPGGRTEARLVGRRWEVAALEAIMERAIDGRGDVVNVVGPPGIGKSRVAREAAAFARSRGVDVFWTFCESHAGDVPFRVVAQLLRARIGVADLADESARARVRDQFPAADPQDLLLLDDLLGISDPGVALPSINPDARRRRLTALINTTSLARTTPALFIVDDAQWIDSVSESMLTDFLSVIPRTRSMVLVTARPEYQGPLRHVVGAQTIALGALGDPDIAMLLHELLGLDTSIGELATIIAERADGNPFFAEEMVRELAQRGALAGQTGAYRCVTAVADVSVPATVQSAIEARIDRLSAPAKRTLNAASVIGARFNTDLLPALGIEPVLDELLHAELIDQVGFVPIAEFAFRHPLIRAVAYESQLKSDRAQWHRRLAAAMEHASPAAEENGALIAEHLEAAGELRAAYDWHMRAGAWSTNRDLAAARISWERARRIADGLPGDAPAVLAMRITPRTMLCATDWQAREVQETGARFAELQQLCAAAEDNASLAIAMTGLATEVLYEGHARQAAQLSSQQMAQFEYMGDPTPAMGVAAIAFINWLGVGEFAEVLRWSQTIIDLAAGDPAKGASYGVGSPLAIALAWRGTARWWQGRPGWHRDLHDAVAMARRSNPETLSGAIAWTYGFAVQYGVLSVDESLLRTSEDALRTAYSASSDRAVGLAAYTVAVALLNRDSAADRDRGLELMRQVRGIWLRKRALFLIPVTDMWAARELFRRGECEGAIEQMRGAVDELRRMGNVFYGFWATGVLGQALLERGAEADLAEASASLDDMARTGANSAIRDVTLLRLRALLAHSRGAEVTYRDYRDRYRAMTKSLGFEQHLIWADALP
ncbi:cyclase [Mycobacterium sp. ENV421]|uniref:ATP-binding protein n=1 Tax=Mycobacterium sp. ENV421 TaxID=1213407 RepID=UPI000C9CA202|nr:adenylate/guanylate cyclase domain-containing protein [Mycobacterium sp. ENV421]PND54420.1 cyclase [Mycobacterium sp. ENV421]